MILSTDLLQQQWEIKSHPNVLLEQSLFGTSLHLTFTSSVHFFKLKEGFTGKNILRNNYISAFWKKELDMK